MRAWVDGSLKVQRVEVSPAVLAGTDDASREQAERLVAEAVNDGLDKAKHRMAEAMRAEAAELGLDDLPIDIAKLLG